MLFAAETGFQRRLQPRSAALASRGVSADALTYAAGAVSRPAGANLAASRERPALLGIPGPHAVAAPFPEFDDKAGSR